MPNLRRSTAISLMVMVVSGPALAEGITAVTLLSGGLAEVLTRHVVTGDDSIRIVIPADQIDDILKSLVVRDPNGTVRGLRLDGPAQAEETLKRLPFTADDIASPARLANALQGVGIRVESDGKSIEGASLGVSERPGSRDEGTVRTLSVMTQSGQIDSVRLVEGASLAILDPTMVARLREAAGALGAAKVSSARTVEIAVAGKGEREVVISYVVPAPVWKTAYRIVSDEAGNARIQAWAIVENATGADWKDVALTLQTGAPVTLHQRLFQRFWRERPEVPVEAEVARVPQVDRGALRSPAPQAGRDQAQAFRFSEGGRLDRSTAPAEVARPAVPVETVEGAVTASYRLPTPVTLGAGGTLSVPIVDADMPSERISLYRPGDGLHPIAAISLRNAGQTTLPPGILTVYDKAAGYVGDARLPATPPGEERFASFATDRKVQVRVERKPEERISSIKVVDGVARVSSVSRQITTYTVQGASDGARVVVIEQPRAAGWTLSSSASIGETATAHRLRVTLAAGQTKEVVAIGELPRLDTFQLADADEAQLLRWARSPADARTAEKLKAIAAIRTSVAAAEGEIKAAEEKIALLKSDQERIRANMEAAPRESTFGKKLLAQLEASDAQIASTSGVREKAAERRDSLRTQIRTAIADF